MMGKASQAIKQRAEAKRLRASSQTVLSSSTPDLLFADFMIHDAKELEASARENLSQPHSSLAGVGGELVPDGGQLPEGSMFLDTIKHPNAVSAEASLERLKLADAGIEGIALAIDTAESIKAANSVEKMMAHQMAAAHKLAMAFAGEAKRLAEHKQNGWDDEVSPYAQEATQLAKSSARMMDAFQKAALAIQKLRTGGKQTVTVQHVNVNDGGQAVVTGGINRGGKDAK